MSRDRGAAQPFLFLLRAIVLLLGVLAVVACEEGRPALTSIPPVDLTGVEPAVRTAIANASSSVDEAIKERRPNGQLAEAYGELAMRYHVHDFAKQAEAAYQNARALAPRDKRWSYLLGHLYNDSARQEDAIAAFEAALRIDGDDPTTLASLAAVLLQHGDFDRAQDAYEHLLGLKSGRAVALAGLGKVAMAKRDYKLAASRFEECLALEPGATKLLAPLAAAYRAEGQPDKAEAALRRRAGPPAEPSLADPLADLLDSKIASSRGLLRRGQRFGNVGRFDLALEAFRAAAAANPSDAEALANLGISLANLGRLDEAAKALSDSLRIDGANALAHTSLAVVYDRQGRDSEAIGEYRAALHQDPDNAQATIYLADALMRAGDGQGAAALYEKSLAKAPSGRVRFSLVLADVRSHRFAAAKQQLEAALAESPDSPVLINALARVLATAKDDAVRDGPRAFALAKSLFEKTRSPDVGQTYAMAMAATGDFEHAVKLQEETIIAYERMGAPQAKPFLELNLAKFRAGERAAEPWSPDDPLLQPRSPAVARQQRRRPIRRRSRRPRGARAREFNAGKPDVTACLAASADSGFFQGPEAITETNIVKETAPVNRSALCAIVVAIAIPVTLAACGGGDDGLAVTAVNNVPPVDTPIPLTVPKASCGPTDTPETGLQGQVPAAVRAAGFKGYNCNLTLIGSSRNEGASWQHAFFKDQAGHTCYFYDTSSSTVNRVHQGVVTIDGTDATKPTATAFLNTTGMRDPWESLKVNDRRQLLAAVNALNGNGGPELDIYDLSGDCRSPQLLSSMAVNTGADGGATGTVQGHEGSFAPDGLTYYASNLFPGYVYPIDVTNTTKPKMLGKFLMPGPVALTHGMAISDDGNRAYFTIFGQGAAQVTPPATATNGVVIADVSDFQKRVANPQMRVISTLIIPDGSASQHTIEVKINGKKYLVEADEGGAGGNNAAGWAKACAAGLPAWNMARLIDISDETKPVVVSRMQLEMNDPAKCAQVIPDLAGLSGFTYGAHYCSVDNKQSATTLACGYFESGIRVFDIRDPLRPKEIAYYNPPAVTTPSPGSQNNRTAANGRPDHCSAQVKLDAVAGTLSTTCQDNGFLSLKFRSGVWPFPETTTPVGQQN